MTQDTLCPDGPFRVSLKVYVTNGDTTGIADYDLPAGRIPDDDAVRAAVAEVLALPPLAGYRHLTRHELVAYLLEESTGQTGFAIPGANSFRLYPEEQADGGA